MARPALPGDAERPDALFAAMMGSLPESAVLTDAAQVIVYVNEAFTAMTGYTAGDAVGRNCRFLQGPESDRIVVASIRDSLAHRSSFRGTVLNYRKDGTSFWNEMAIAPVLDAAGRLTHLVGLQRDVSSSVTDRSRLVGVLQGTERERSTFRTLLDIAGSLPQQVTTPAVATTVADAILGLCAADRSAVAVWDPTAARLSIVGQRGWPEDLADALTRVDLSPSESPELAEIIVQREPTLVGRPGPSEWARWALDRFRIEAFAAVPVHSEGELRGLLLAYWSQKPAPAALEPDLRARLAGLAGLTAVALDNARLVEEARWSATHDPLTGLPNRAHLQQQLEQALREASEHAPTAVIFCDIDGLKRTNDALGHDAGDHVLKEVATRLRAALRPEDTVSRIGGDEFVILLAQAQGEAEVRAILGRLEASLATPVRVGDRSIAVRLSMGLAFSSDPLLATSAAAASTALIRAADVAMYQLKSEGTSLLARAPLGRHQQLAADLARAVDQGQITVAYQPQLDLGTGRITGAEALARWTHPLLGPIDPVEFIPVAEMTGQIAALGRFVLEQACTDIASIRRTHPEFRLSVNVSNDQLDFLGFPGTVSDTLAAAGLPAVALTLEITESKLPADRQVTQGQLAELRSLGVGIALDDFGTGFTSLTQLRDIPATELKIDGSYIQQQPADGRDLLPGLVGLAHGLDLQVVAEGTATEPQLARARAAGFDRAQGYAIGRPMTAAALSGYLTTTEGTR